MTPITRKLHYGNHALEGLMLDGQIWLDAGQIDRALGYSHQDQVTRLYRRNRDEFMDSEVRRVEKMTGHGPRETLVFSLRGCYLLAILARTTQGKKFRVWILDVLTWRRQRKAIQQLLLPGSSSVSSETARALQDLLQLIEAGYPPQNAVQEILDGSRPLSRDPELDNIMEQVRLGRKMKSQGALIESNALRDAARRNYSREFVQMELLRAPPESSCPDGEG